MPLTRPLRRLLAPLAATPVALALVVGSALPATASPRAVPDATDKVDCLVVAADGTCQTAGTVYAIAQAGDRTFVGGLFKSVAGTERSNLAAFGPDGTLVQAWDAPTDGVVYALAVSSDGGTLFVGGGFTTVDGVPRGRLAALATADGAALSSAFTTTPSNNLVRALATDDADRLYVGGSFSRIGGKAVPRLAALAQSTGAVDTGFVPQPSATVRALSLSDDGDELYAAGGFTSVGGALRPGAAELDATSGRATAFAPSEGGVVISIDATPSGRLFFGTTSNRTYAYDVAGDAVPEYRVRTGGDVQAIYATDSEVYIGGHFNTLPEAKLSRVALASFAPATGVPTSWNPGANGPFGVWAIAPTATPQVVGSKLAVGGDFTRVGGQARRGFTTFTF